MALKLADTSSFLPPRLGDLLRLRFGPAVMAEMYQRDGARVVELVHALETSRITVRQTLDHLVTCGWLKANPGYGHPLRPEFVLTAEGRDIGARCSVLRRAARRACVEGAMLRRWSVPLVVSIGSGVDRFRELARVLDPITDRALSQALQVLEGADIVDRRVGGGDGREIRYHLGGAGAALRTPCRRLTEFFARG
ncbi:MAG: winged helix-turn-helix transcriptional regulator [Phycisphaerales bacterium]|nr:winged helix-turn-helix transcriptional regulator [Phycisphaerales bacterium]